MSRIGDGAHEHKPPIDGRAQEAARYPQALIKAMCRGILKDNMQIKKLDVRAVVEIQEGDHWMILNLEQNHEEEETYSERPRLA